VNWLDAAPFLARLVLGLLGAALVWWSAFDLGRTAFEAFRIRHRRDDAIPAALGYALVGTIVAALGLVHLIALTAFLALFAVQFAFRWIRGKRFPLRLPPDAWRSLRSLGFLDACAVAATCFAWLTATIAAALPASWWDPIAYHLPIAARALSTHTFVIDPAMIQTIFPLLGEAAAVPAFAIGGSAGAAFATLGCGIVLALVCGAWAERIAAGSGRLAVALVSCSALWLWLAPSFYVDVTFAMFAIAALALASLAASDDGDPGGWAVAAGALAGAAAATKYPGLAVVALAACVAVAAARPGMRFRAGIDVVAAAIAIAGGWYVRTAMLAGDPVFPFLTTHAVGPIGDFAQRYVSMTRSWCGGGSTLADAIALPWRLMTRPATFCGDPGYALDLAAVFVLASLAAFRRTVAVLILCGALTAFWFFSSQQLRFLVPALCLYAIAAAVGTCAITPRLRALGQSALLLLCIVGVAVDWIPDRRDASNSIAPAYPYVLGARSGDDYLLERLEFYDAVRWLKANGGGAPSAALDDVRDYYFGPSTRWLNPYYQPLAIDWSSRSDLRYRRLTVSGFRYLIVNANPAYVHRTPTGVDWRVLDQDVKNGTLRDRFSARGVTVYELPPRADR
jgi:hypothetical protein